MKLNLHRLAHPTTFMILLISAVLTMIACGPKDDDNNSGTPNSNGNDNNVTRYDVTDGDITVTYNGKTHTAKRDTEGQITRMAQYNQLVTSFQSHWGEAGKLPYVIRTNVILTEEPGKEIHPGEYTIHDFDDILLQNSRLAALTFFSSDLNVPLQEDLPANFIATAGTITYELLNADGDEPKTAVYTFDADFRNANDDDKTVYKMSGKVTAIH